MRKINMFEAFQTNTSLAGFERWQTFTTEHFIFHYYSDTTAKHSVMLVDARLAAVREATLRLLALPRIADKPIPVYLCNSPDDEIPPGGSNTGAATEPVTWQLAGVYRNDAPGEALERGLVELLLAAALGDQVRQSPFIVDGVLGFVMEQANTRRHRPSRQALHEHLQQGQPISLMAFVSGAASRVEPLYFQVASAFVAFLVKTYGPDRFRLFAQMFDATDPNRAVERAFGKALTVLEKEWINALREPQQQLMGLGGLLRAMGRLVWPHRGLALLVPLAFAPIIAFRAVSPLIFKAIIDGGLMQRNHRLLIILISALFALLLAKAAGLFARDYLVARLTARSVNDLRLKVLSHLQCLSHDFYARSQVGDLVSRLSTDLDTIETALGQALPVALLMGAVCIVSGVLMFTQDWLLSLIIFILLPLLYLDFRLIGPRAEHASFQRQRDAAQVLSTVEEYVLARPVAVAFGLNERILARFKNQLTTLVDSTIRVGLLSGMLSLSAIGGGALVSALVVSIGAFMVLHGHLTVGGLVAFYGLVSQVVNPIEWVALQIQPMEKAIGAFQRLEELLDERPQVLDAADAQPVPSLAREIRCQDLTFSYTGARMDLPHLTLTIPAGQSVALVGPSGCGKSTVLSLLMRFYDPTMGSISIDGHDLRRVTQSSLRAQIGVVFQESILFNTTIRENIRLGHLEATDTEVETAARVAEIHEFIMGLPQGYETIVGERGGRLSGGQRQRIAIARAILRNPPLLLLDEATSSLDAEAETLVNATLRKVAKGRTVISVTHRLAVAAAADRIVILQAGRVVEDGTHDTLLLQQGLYYRMWQQQHGMPQVDPARDTAAALERLRSIPMFRDLDEVSLGFLVGRLTAEEYAAGEIVYAEGDPADRLYIIVHGAVEVRCIGPTGSEELLTVLAEGDHFGEMALRRELPRTTTVRTRQVCTFLILERQWILKNMGDIVSLPDTERRLVAWILRQEGVSTAEVAAATGHDEESVRQVLDALVTKGYLQESAKDAQTRYRVHLARRRESRLAGEIWQALRDV